MVKQHRRTIRQWGFYVLLIASLSLSFGLSHLPAIGQIALERSLALNPLQVETRFSEIDSIDRTLSPEQLVQQGVEDYLQSKYESAIAHWQLALAAYQQRDRPSDAVIVLENLARAHQQLGQLEQAIAYWQQATATYRDLNRGEQVGRMLTEQAQVYTRLGQYRQAITLLCNDPSEDTCAPGSALGLLQGEDHQRLQAAALGSLGEAHRLRGDYNRATQYLERSLDLSRAVDDSAMMTAALSGLGHTTLGLAQINYQRGASAEQIGDTTDAADFRRQGTTYDQDALTYLQEALTQAQQRDDQVSQIRLLLSLISPAARLGNIDLAQTSLQDARQLLSRLPASREKAIAAIHMVQFLELTVATDTSSNDRQAVHPLQCINSRVQSDAVTLLETALQTARQIQNLRLESFALGELGHIFECQRNYTQALELTRQARWSAEQDLRAKDSLYLWEWQTGRILRSEGYESEAIAAYEQSIKTLEDIRSDLLIANQDLQYDFRDTIDPLYRQLVTLRLEREAGQVGQATPVSRDNVTAVLSQLDSLKVAELENYFGDECLVLVGETPVDLVGATSATAVFSTVILDDRTAVLVSFPDGSQQMTWIDRSAQAFRDEVNSYRVGLERFFDDFDPQQAERLYRWIIAPFESELTAANIKTLVFIQDGILRSVPMGALYDSDRQQFLIEQYAIATTPSLTLTDSRPINRQRLRALALGLTQETTVDGQRFPALGNVAQEIAAIQAQLPGSLGLLNQDFTRERLQAELSRTSYPIIHIATHGEFGVEPQNTFLVTGDAQKLTLTDLDITLRQALQQNTIELLSLTACQTAIGDDRSSLGLAGVALQAGSKSAIASLWFIDDAVTAEVASQFYINLRDNPEKNKAEALQAAQLQIIRAGGVTAHPAYWAPFILVGNWL